MFRNRFLKPKTQVRDLASSFSHQTHPSNMDLQPAKRMKGLATNDIFDSVDDPIFLYCLTKLFPSQIAMIYETCSTFKIKVDANFNWLDRNCLHQKPHSINDLPIVLVPNSRQEWYKNGKLHRDNDLPAAIWTCGTKAWYKNGKRHRDGDLPSFIWEDGSEEWYKAGERHRDGDLPAVISSDGIRYWYKNGKIHRDGDLPAVIWADGTQKWYKDGKLHRDGDLPAVIWTDGSQFWFKNGHLSVALAL